MICEAMQSFSRERNILKEDSNIFEIQRKVCQGNAILLKEDSNILQANAKFVKEKQYFY